MLNKLIKISEKHDYTVKQGYFKNENKFVFFQKNKTRDLVILVHGLGNNLVYGNQALISNFLERDLNILCFNLDGHGSNKGGSFNYDTIREALLPAIDMAEKEGDYNIHLVGYSVGAYICARYANLNPDLVSSLHLIAPLGSIDFNAKIVVSEITGILNKEVAQNIKTWGLSEMIPSIGFFRRWKFPLRHNEKNIHRSVYNWLRVDEKEDVFYCNQYVG